MGKVKNTVRPAYHVVGAGGLLLSLVLFSCSVSPLAPSGPREWTIMIYMGADNNLKSSAILALHAMEAASLNGSGVTVLALADGIGTGGGTRLYEITHGSSSGSTLVSQRLSSTKLGLSASYDSNLDMGQSQTLRNFIEFGKSSYPAAHYGVILWGHGIGYRSLGTPPPKAPRDPEIVKGVIYDQTSGDYLYTDRMRLALDDEGVEFVGIDACYGATIEHAYEIRNSTRYLVASENDIAESGWNYTDLLGRIAAKHSDALSVSNDIVDSYAVAYGNSNQASGIATMGIVDLSKIDGVNTAFNTFSNAVHDAITTHTFQMNVRNSFYANGVDFYTTPGELIHTVNGGQCRLMPIFS